MRKLKAAAEALGDGNPATLRLRDQAAADAWNASPAAQATLAALKQRAACRCTRSCRIGIEISGANVSFAQRRAGRGPVGAVQLMVHPVRPVLRSRPRPGEQGRQWHRLHSAAAGRSAPSRCPDAAADDARNFMVLTRATTSPGADGVLGDNPSTPLVNESLDDGRPVNTTTSHRRPEPDLHVASVASGVPACI